MRHGGYHSTNFLELMAELDRGGADGEAPPLAIRSAPPARSDGGHAYRWLARPPEPDEMFTGFGRATHEQREDTLRALSQLAQMMRNVGIDQSAEWSNPNIPAGYTYLGQFIAHDMVDTRPVTASGDGPAAQNDRRRVLCLESIYGDGPDACPWLYEPEEHADDPRVRLRLGRTVNDRIVPVVDPPLAFDDIARADSRQIVGGASGYRHTCDPLIGDSRNEDNLILSQLVVTIHKVHNRLIDLLSDLDPISSTSRQDRRRQLRRHFQIARHLTTQAYRNVVIHDFIPKFIAADLWDSHYGDYLNAIEDPESHETACRNLSGKEAIPLEFTMAAFRFGHVMVRTLYNFNGSHRKDDARLQDLMEFSGLDGDIKRLPLIYHWVIDWQKFFFDPATVPSPNYASEHNFSRRIRPAVSATLADEERMQSEDQNEGGLLYRTLARGYVLSLWNGQRLAECLGIQDQIQSGAVAKLLRDYSKLAGTRALSDNVITMLANDTPLFLYIIAEAMIRERGERLGPLGQKIVATVLFEQLILSHEFMSDDIASNLSLIDEIGPNDQWTMENFIKFSGHGMTA